MRQVPNGIVTTLARALPIVLANVNTSGKSTRVRNAARLTKLALDKLIKINDNEQSKSNNQS